MNQSNDRHLPKHLAEVGRMLAEGKTNHNIAQELVVALHTAEKYVSELKQLMGAHDRVNLAFRCKEKLGSRLP